MTIMPGNKKDNISRSANDLSSLPEHNERMRKFRLAHPGLPVKAPREVKPMGRLAFVPIPLVELNPFLQN